MKNLIKKALLCVNVMQYLPDKEELKPGQLSKDFLCTVINTVDQDFFPQVITQIEKQRRDALPKGGDKDCI